LRTALEQPRAEAGFDLAQHLAQGRLAQVQAAGRGAHRACIGKRYQQLEVAQPEPAHEVVVRIHDHPTLSRHQDY